ncbi:SAYSvFN domain-containing protein 1 [Myzus persicae]|uniref:SAYSvFN domain-containing protein 1 n=1 Tax=Myzus persicae TaxID=13164 RepID=UPI000B934FE8|nr:SAYSvFN domain-containing protein 1 [Myzus persicae]
METETIVMSSRRRMVLKPLSAPAATLQCKVQNTSNDTNEYDKIQPLSSLIAPKNDRKKLLFQDVIVPEIIPPVQRNKVLLSCTINSDMSVSDDSDSEDSTKTNVPLNKSPKSNTKLYYTIIMFLCWAAVQYWMIAVVGFGAVFFAISALIAMYYNTSNSEKKHNVLSAYSVFNPQCTPIQGSVDPKQLERELLFG